MVLKFLTGLAATMLMVGCSTISGDSRPKIDGVVEEFTEGYAGDGKGNILVAGDGTCLRTGRYSAGNKVDGCEIAEENIEENAAENVEEDVAELDAAPEPVSIPEPAPAPEPTVTTLSIDGSAMFAVDSHRLNDSGVAALNDLVRRLSNAQEIESMRVTGHTDSTGKESYNQVLSERRAAIVAAFLEGAYPGVPVSSVGEGELNPTASNSTSEGRQANRRVEVDVIARQIIQN